MAEANLIVAREIKKTEWEEENDYSTSMAPTYGMTPKQKFQTIRVQALASLAEANLSVAEANLIVAREIKKMEWEEENDYSTSMAPTYGMTSKQKFQTIRVQALASVVEANLRGAEANLIVAKEIEKTEWEEENAETLQFNASDRTITVIEEGNESGSFFLEYLARLEVTPGIYLNLESLSSSIPSPASCNLQAVQGTGDGNASTLDDEAGPLLLDDFDDYAGDEFEENLPLSPSLSISSTQTPPQESSSSDNDDGGAAASDGNDDDSVELGSKWVQVKVKLLRRPASVRRFVRRSCRLMGKTRVVYGP